MDVYGHRKQTYKAGLAQLTQRQASFEQRTLPTQISLPFYTAPAPVQHTPTATTNHNHIPGNTNGNFSRAPPPQHQQQQQQQRPVKFADNDTRTSSHLGRHAYNYMNKSNSTSPYYSKVVEPTTPDQSTGINNDTSITANNSSDSTIVRSPDKNASGGKKGFQKWANYRIPSIDRDASTSTASTPSPPLLLSTTIRLVQAFGRRDSKFKYHQNRNPKRILTKPSKPAKNDGYDNEDHDYILHVNDILGEDENYSYRVIDLLGQGTFGQVVKCEQLSSGKLFSVKVIKNRPAFRTQSCMEVEILKQLNQKMDSRNQHHILRLEHTFNHKNHLCLVFELLSFNLYELIKQNGFKGLSIQLVRNITTQLLETLVFLGDIMIIHCDLKPENILLEAVDSPKIKVIDFGSACHKANLGYTYIQSRFYRSPEVILKCRYTHAIDMWSLGCIVAELFLGIPLFPGNNEYDQLDRIMDMLGQPPSDVLDRGGNTMLYFDRESIGHGKYQYKRKSREKYNKDNHKQEMPTKRFFQHNNLPDIIMNANPSLKPPVSGTQAFRLENQMRQWLVDFLLHTLTLSPLRRWSPKEALRHPFITGKSASAEPTASDIASKSLPSHPTTQPRHSTSTGVNNHQHLTTNKISEKPQARQQEQQHVQQSAMDHQQKQNHERYLYHQRQKLQHQQQQEQYQSHQRQNQTETGNTRKVESFETSPLVTVDPQQPSRHYRSRSLHAPNAPHVSSNSTTQGNPIKSLLQPSSSLVSSSKLATTTIAERRAQRFQHANSSENGQVRGPSPKKSSSDTITNNSSYHHHHQPERQQQHYPSGTQKQQYRSSVSFAPDPLKEIESPAIYTTTTTATTFSSSFAPPSKSVPKPVLKNNSPTSKSTKTRTYPHDYGADGDQHYNPASTIPPTSSQLSLKYLNGRQQSLYG